MLMDVIDGADDFEDIIDDSNDVEEDIDCDDYDEDEEEDIAYVRSFICNSLILFNMPLLKTAVILQHWWK